MTYAKIKSLLKEVKVFFNHIHKTGGTSLETLLENDSDLQYIRIRSNNSEKDLERIANQFIKGNIIIQGHINEPFYGYCPNQYRIEFWNFIYQASDIKFSVLRHPFDRALSYAKYSGFNDGVSHEDFDPKFFYKFVPWPANAKESKLFQAFQKHHTKANHIDLTLFEDILPENFMLNFPESQNLSICINEYPIALFSKSELHNFLIPSSLRHEKFDHTLFFKNFNAKFIFDQLKIPYLQLFAFEDLEFIYEWLKQKNIINGNIKLPHKNKTKFKNSDNNIDEAKIKMIKSEIAREYPESFLLWKLAAMRAIAN